jgi:hypothetical protein
MFLLRAARLLEAIDIRGVFPRRYRANSVYTLQAEYRWNFYKKWGLVAFAGLASAVAKIGDIPDSDILPELVQAYGSECCHLKK